VIEHENDRAFEVRVPELGRRHQQPTDKTFGDLGPRCTVPDDIGTVIDPGSVGIVGIVRPRIGLVSGHTLIMPPPGPTRAHPGRRHYGGVTVEPVTIYLHPACSKSRAATELLETGHVAFDAVDYLVTPPGAERLGQLLDMLDGAPTDLVRVDDDRFTELGLTAADIAHREGVVAVLVAHPELMQRPVVVRGNRAIVARPPDLLATFLADTTPTTDERNSPAPGV
jgi:arsenate reductase